MEVSNLGLAHDKVHFLPAYLNVNAWERDFKSLHVFLF